jgi:hypothetical protein
MNCSVQAEEFESVINCAVTYKAYGPSQFLRRDILHFRPLKKPQSSGKPKVAPLLEYG